MKKMMFVAVLLLILAPTLIHAQDDLFAWEPDPSEIFADGVEIVDKVYRMPDSIRIDNAARVVEALDPSTGLMHTVPYDERIDELNDSAYHRSDSTILFNAPPPRMGRGEPDQSAPLPWMLELPSGEWSQPEQVCGAYVRALPGEAEWVIYTDQQVNRRALCNTETGESVALFPDRVVDLDFVIESPSGTWLFIVAANQCCGGGYEHYYFGLNLATGRFNDLGSVEMPGNIYYDHHFVTDTIVVDQNYDLIHYDLTRPNSRQYFDLLADFAWHRGNPPRYEYISTRLKRIRDGETPIEAARCQMEFLTHETLERFSHDLAYECGGVAGLEGLDYLVLAFDEPAVETSTLYRLDAATGERTELLKGEFESLESASPDGRYAVLIEDDNGLVQRSREGFLYEFRMSDFGNLRGRIYDTQTGAAVYELGTITKDDDILISGAQHSVYSDNAYMVWRDNSTLFIISGGKNQMIEFGTDSVEVIEFYGLASRNLLPNVDRNNWLLYTTWHHPEGAYYVFNHPSGQQMLLFEDNPQHSIRSEDSRWVGDDLLEVELFRPGSDQTIIYTIRIPQPEDNP